MLLISFVCSITSIPFKTGCSVCSSWSFCLYCWLLSSILGCLFVFLNEGLWISICGYDKFLCHCSNLFPQQTLPLNGEAEQEVPIEHVCGEQRAGRQVGALRLSKKGRLYFTGETLWCILFLGRAYLSAYAHPSGTCRVNWHCFASSGTNTGSQNLPQQTLQLIRLLSQGFYI